MGVARAEPAQVGFVRHNAARLRRPFIVTSSAATIVRSREHQQPVGHYSAAHSRIHRTLCSR